MDERTIFVGMLLLILLSSIYTVYGINQIQEKDNNKELILEVMNQSNTASGRWKDCVNTNNRLTDKYNKQLKEYKELDKAYDELFNSTLNITDNFNKINQMYTQKIDYSWTGCIKNPSMTACEDDDCDYGIKCTDSMKPTISCVNRLHLCTAIGENITKGDIILYNYEEGEEIILHRVIEDYEDGSYAVKGDNNLERDADLIDFEDIIGKLDRIEG